MEFPTTTVSLEVEGYEGLASSKITKFVPVPSKNLVVLRGLSHPRIYLCKEGCRGAFVNTYRGHYEPPLRNHIVCLIHLVDGVVCSMDTGGNILTWEARTAQEQESIGQAGENESQGPETNILGRFKVEDNSRSLVKLGDTEFAVAGGFNGVHIFKHNRGRNIMQVRDISGSMTNVRNIASLGVHGDQMVVAGNDAREDGDGIAEVWNAITTTRIAHFAIGKKIDSVQVSAQYIVCAFYGDGGIEIYANDGTNRLLARVESHFLLSEEVLEVAIISGEVMMVTCAEQGQSGIVGGSSGVYFISLPDGLIRHHFEFQRPAEVGCSTVLRDGRIYVGASDGKCEAFQAPENYRSDVQRYAAILYGNVAPPLVAAPPAPAPPNVVNEADEYNEVNVVNNADNADAGDAGNGVVSTDANDEVNAADSANGGTSPASSPASGARRRSRAEFEGRRGSMDATEVTAELQSQRAMLTSMAEELRATNTILRRMMARTRTSR